MAHPGGSNSTGTTNRDFGLPAERDIGETRQERIIREATITKLCRYCEASFLQRQKGQRFHDQRCIQQYRSGHIDEVTFTRWARSLRIIQRWWEGEGEGLYVDPEDYRTWDYARAELYRTVAELKARAHRSCGNDAARAYKLLAEAYEAIFAMPEPFDLHILHSPYCGNIEEPMHPDWTQREQTPLPCRGLDAWKLIQETFERRIKHNRPNWDWSKGSSWYHQEV